MTNAVKYFQVAFHCGCEIQNVCLSVRVIVEGSDDDDDGR